MSVSDTESVFTQVLEGEVISLDALQRLRDHCDTDADVVLSAIQNQLRKVAEHDSLRRKHDLFSILQAGTKSSPVLAQFWSDVNLVPDWVDWPQLERGQRVFHRYILASITGFILQGFVGENSAASGVVEVLTRTRGFDPKNLTRRLKETFRWLLEVTSDLKSIQPGGNGHADTIRVRLLHAQVRQRVLALTERKSDYYNSAKYGLPINTLDSVHSISTFCCSPMWSQLPKIGIHPAEDEIKDYVALFRYLGHLLGVPQRLFDTTSRAKAIMHLMMEHESHPSATSQTVAHNFIQAITSTEPYKLSVGFVAAGSRSMNGDELCDKLNIHRPTLLHYATFRGCCWLAITLCHLQRWCITLDEFVISNSRRALNRVFVDPEVASSAELPFIFRYVPTLSCSAIDKAKSKQTASLSLAVDAENLFRAVFLFYVCVIGSLSLTAVWFLRLIVPPDLIVNLWVSITG